MTIAGGVGVDMRRVKARKDAIVAQSRDGLTAALENAAGRFNGCRFPYVMSSRAGGVPR